MNKYYQYRDSSSIMVDVTMIDRKVKVLDVKKNKERRLLM
jgi:hypothetical protein